MKTIVTLGLSVAAIGTVVAGGVAVSSFLAGGGTQPEDVLPASTIGFVKVDLNPSASQKLNVLRLMEKLPDVERKDDDLKRTIVEDMLDEGGLDLDYTEDVEPWLGDRVAVAAVPASSGETSEPVPLVALEFTDEAAVVETLDEVEKQLVADHDAGSGVVSDFTVLSGPEPRERPGADGEPFDPFDYAISETYVIIGEEQADVDRAAASEDRLSASETFSADKDSIDGENQIVLGWVDVARAYATVPEDEKAEFAESLGAAEPAGRMVMGVHAESDAIEATGRTFDLQAGGTQTVAAGGRGTGLVRDLPPDTDIAFSATGLGAVAAELWQEHGTDPDLGLAQEAESMGLKMPGDLVALLGSEAALGIVLPPEGEDELAVTGRVATEAPDRAMELLDIVEAFEPSEEVHTSTTPDGYVVSTHRAHLDEATDGDMSLADDEVFARAVPGADEAGALVFVDVRPVVTMLSTWGGPGRPVQEESGWESVEAFGATATGEEGTGEFTMRLTFR